MCENWRSTRALERFILCYFSLEVTKSSYSSKLELHVKSSSTWVSVIAAPVVWCWLFMFDCQKRATLTMLVTKFTSAALYVYVWKPNIHWALSPDGRCCFTSQLEIVTSVCLWTFFWCYQLISTVKMSCASESRKINMYNHAVYISKSHIVF